MNLRNLTPHTIDIYANETDIIPCLSIPPDANLLPARCEENIVQTGHITCSGGGAGQDAAILVPLFSHTYGAVSGLPMNHEANARDTWFIVSRMVAQAVQGNTAYNVLVPGRAKRDANGRVIGCIGLAQV